MITFNSGDEMLKSKIRTRLNRLCGNKKFIAGFLVLILGSVVAEPIRTVVEASSSQVSSVSVQAPDIANAAVFASVVNNIGSVLFPIGTALMGAVVVVQVATGYKVYAAKTSNSGDEDFQTTDHE